MCDGREKATVDGWAKARVYSKGFPVDTRGSNGVDAAGLACRETASVQCKPLSPRPQCRQKQYTLCIQTNDGLGATYYLFRGGRRPVRTGSAAGMRDLCKGQREDGKDWRRENEWGVLPSITLPVIHRVEGGMAEVVLDPAADVRPDGMA